MTVTVECADPRVLAEHERRHVGFSPRCVDVNDAPVGCPCKTAPCREAVMVPITTADGRAGSCDPCIAPFVRALNAGGIPTVASCCGHGTFAGWVGLRDGRWVVLSARQPDEGMLWALAGEGR